MNEIDAEIDHHMTAELGLRPSRSQAMKILLREALAARTERRKNKAK